MVHLYFFQDPELLSSLPFPKHLSIWREGRKGEEGSSESVLSCDTTPHLFSTYGPEKEKKVLVNQSCPTLCVPMDSGPHRLLCPGDFPGTNIGVGLPFPSPGVFLTQGSNPGLLHYRQLLYCLSHQREALKRQIGLCCVLLIPPHGFPSCLRITDDLASLTSSLTPLP